MPGRSPSIDSASGLFEMQHSERRFPEISHQHRANRRPLTRDGQEGPQRSAGGRPIRRVLTHKGHEFLEIPASDVTCDQLCAMAWQLCSGMSLSSLPIAQWLPKYTLNSFRSDLVAGLSVGILLIPQSMAYSLLAGLPAIYGLYSSVVPLIVYALFASSTKVSMGPVATTSILINGIIMSAASDPSDTKELALLATTVSFATGIIQIVLGIFRFGFISQLLSWPVMSGYLAGAGVTIVASQLKDFFGATYPKGTVDRLFYERIGNFFSNLNTVTWETTLISLASFVILVGYKYLPACGLWPRCIRVRCGDKPPRWMPMQLIVVVACLGLAAGIGLTPNGYEKGTQRIDVIGSIPAGLPAPSLPLKGDGTVFTTLPQSFILAIIAYVGTISLGVSFARKDSEDVSANMELFASGAACLAGSFFKGFTVSGSFTRTAVNADIGAKTPVAVMCTALLLVLTLQFLSPLFETLPKGTLAAMVVASTQSLLKPVELAMFWRQRKLEGFLASVTFIFTLWLGIEWGIIAAVGLALALLLLRSFKPRITELGNLPGTSVFVDRARYPEANFVKGVIVYRVDGDIHFGNAKTITTLLRKTLVQAVQTGAVPTPLKPKEDESKVKGVGDGHISDEEDGVVGARARSPEAGDDRGGSGSGDCGVEMSSSSSSSSSSSAAGPAAGTAHVAEAADDSESDTWSVEGGMPRGALQAVVIDCIRVTSVDLTACRELRTLAGEYAMHGVRFLLAALPGPARDSVEKYGVMMSDEELEEMKEAMGAGRSISPTKRYLTVAAAVGSVVPRHKWPAPLPSAASERPRSGSGEDGDDGGDEEEGGGAESDGEASEHTEITT